MEFELFRLEIKAISLTSALEINSLQPIIRIFIELYY